MEDLRTVSPVSKLGPTLMAYIVVGTIFLNGCVPEKPKLVSLEPTPKPNPTATSQVPSIPDEFKDGVNGFEPPKPSDTLQGEVILDPDKKNVFQLLSQAAVSYGISNYLDENPNATLANVPDNLIEEDSKKYSNAMIFFSNNLEKKPDNGNFLHQAFFELLNQGLIKEGPINNEELLKLANIVNTYNEYYDSNLDLISVEKFPDENGKEIRLDEATKSNLFSDWLLFTSIHSEIIPSPQSFESWLKSIIETRESMIKNGFPTTQDGNSTVSFSPYTLILKTPILNEFFNSTDSYDNISIELIINSLKSPNRLSIPELKIRLQKYKNDIHLGLSSYIDPNEQAEFFSFVISGDTDDAKLSEVLSALKHLELNTSTQENTQISQTNPGNNINWDGIQEIVDARKIPDVLKRIDAIVRVMGLKGNTKGTRFNSEESACNIFLTDFFRSLGYNGISHRIDKNFNPVFSGGTEITAGDMNEWLERISKSFYKTKTVTIGENTFSEKVYDKDKGAAVEPEFNTFINDQMGLDLNQRQFVNVTELSYESKIDLLKKGYVFAGTSESHNWVVRGLEINGKTFAVLTQATNNYQNGLLLPNALKLTGKYTSLFALYVGDKIDPTSNRFQRDNKVEITVKNRLPFNPIVAKAFFDMREHRVG